MNRPMTAERIDHISKLYPKTAGWVELRRDDFDDLITALQIAVEGLVEIKDELGYEPGDGTFDVSDRVLTEIEGTQRPWPT